MPLFNPAPSPDKIKFSYLATQLHDSNLDPSKAIKIASERDIRYSAIITNRGDVPIYLDVAQNVTEEKYLIKLMPDGTYEFPVNYAGSIWAWAPQGSLWTIVQLGDRLLGNQ